MRDLAAQKQHPYALNELMILTLQKLYTAYVVVLKDISGDEFLEKVLKPLPLLDSRTTDQPIEILLQYATEEEKAKGADALARLPISPILLSATYYFRAGGARDRGKMDLAWSYLAEAQYWCGVSIAQKGMGTALGQAVGGIKRNMAAAGAKGRSEKFQPLRDLAFDLVRNSAPPAGWSSRNHAVQAIKSRVLDQAEALDIKVSQKNADKTIDIWLASMPEAPQLFSREK